MPKRPIDTNFWTDAKVVDLFSVEDKYFMLYLLTNPHTTQLGIYHISPKFMAFELGYSIETVKVLLERFCNKYHIILWDSNHQEIAIKNYLAYAVISGGTPIEQQLKREITQIKNKDLITTVFNYIKTRNDVNATVLKVVNEYCAKMPYNNSCILDANADANANANANAISGGDTLCDTVCVSNGDTQYDTSIDTEYVSPISETNKKTQKKPRGAKATVPKKQYAEFVYMTEEEYNKLAEKVGISGADQCIEILDNYKGSSGRKYKDDYRAILSWVIDRYNQRPQIQYKQRQNNTLNDTVEMLMQEGY